MKTQSLSWAQGLAAARAELSRFLHKPIEFAMYCGSRDVAAASAIGGRRARM